MPTFITCNYYFRYYHFILSITITKVGTKNKNKINTSSFATYIIVVQKPFNISYKTRMHFLPYYIDLVLPIDSVETKDVANVTRDSELEIIMTILRIVSAHHQF